MLFAALCAAFFGMIGCAQHRAPGFAQETPSLAVASLPPGSRDQRPAARRNDEPIARSQRPSHEVVPSGAASESSAPQADQPIGTSGANEPVRPSASGGSVIVTTTPSPGTGGSAPQHDPNAGGQQSGAAYDSPLFWIVAVTVAAAAAVSFAWYRRRHGVPS